MKGHPNQFIDLCRSEKSIKDDGLIHRFLMCAPKPVFLMAEDMLNAPDLPCSLTLVLLYIYKFHFSEENVGRIYTLSSDASITFNNFFNINRKQVAHVNGLHKDIFIG